MADKQSFSNQAKGNSSNKNTHSNHLDNLLNNETNYQHFFNSASVSLWREDFSRVYLKLKKLRLSGITDLSRHLKENPELSWQLASEVKVLEVNQATVELFEASSESSFLSNIHKHFGPDAIDVFEKSLIASWNKADKFVSRANYITKSGNEVVATISYVPPKNLQDALNLCVVIQDISHLITHERRLEGIISALPDATFILAEDGTYLEVLTNNSNILVGEPQQLIGNKIQDLIEGQIGETILQTVKKVLKNNTKESIEYPLNTQTGVLWFYGRVAPIQQLFKGQRAVVWIASDITDKKELERQLRHSQKMEAIGSLSGGVAHEFNNLLAPILGYSELLMQNKEESHPDTAALKLIHKATHKASKLINQLLIYGQKSINRREDLDLKNIVRDVVQFFDASLPKGIFLSTSLPRQVPAIRGMAEEINQAIVNLCVNAIHSMPNGGNIEIRIPNDTVSLTNTSGEFVAVIVSDNGSGISLDVMQRVFDPFFTTKPIGEGKGLGLSVVHGVMQQHGGKVEVESKLNKGTSFRLLFPVSNTVDPHFNNLEYDNRENVLKGIIVVDHEPMHSELLKDMLEQLDYQVTTVSSAENALELIEQNNYSHMITDYELAHLNGLELAEKTKLINPNIDIILMTGYCSSKLADDSKYQGSLRFLSKPFDLQSLTACLSDNDS